MFQIERNSSLILNAVLLDRSSVMMSHKAFVFDDVAFQEELRLLIESALRDNNVSWLREFIDRNIDRLTDPYEGDALPSYWESAFELPDVHAFGDFALTKYYDPTKDIGLGHEWNRLDDLIPSCAGVSPMLGRPIGLPGAWFDPGRYGSYFQSGADVVTHLSFLTDLGMAGGDVDNVLAMLTYAAEMSRGLYVTF